MSMMLEGFMKIAETLKFALNRLKSPIPPPCCLLCADRPRGIMHTKLAQMERKSETTIHIRMWIVLTAI